MSFASVAELAAYLHQDPFATAAEITAAQLDLDLASGVVVDRTGQTFDAVADDVVTLDTCPGEDVRLPQRPVTAVTSVTTRDMGSAAVTTRTLNTDYEVRADRLRWVGVGWWPYEVTVTYSHGYAVIPGTVKAATLAVAAELHDNPSGLSRSAIDDSTDQYEWADGSPAEKMLKLVARRYGAKSLTVRLG
jgi:hypothetical protein